MPGIAGKQTRKIGLGDFPSREYLAPILNFGDNLDPGEILHRWWSYRLLNNIRWRGLYTFAAAGLLYILLIVSQAPFEVIMGGKPNPRSLYAHLLHWLPFVFVLVRIQLTVLPALVASTDFLPSVWVLLRSVPVTTGEFIRGMFRVGLSFGVMPFVFLGLIELLVDASSKSIEVGFFPAILASACLASLGFALVGLAYLGCQVWRNPFGAVVGSVVPLIFGMMLGIGGLISRKVGYNFEHVSFIRDYFILLATPEVYLAPGLGTDVFTKPTSSTTTSLLETWALLTITATIVWGILILMIERRRNAD